MKILPFGQNHDSIATQSRQSYQSVMFPCGNETCPIVEMLPLGARSETNTEKRINQKYAQNRIMATIGSIKPLNDHYTTHFHSKDVRKTILNIIGKAFDKVPFKAPYGRLSALKYLFRTVTKSCSAYFSRPEIRFSPVLAYYSSLEASCNR